MRAVLPQDGSDFSRTVNDPLGNHFAARPGRRENFWPNFVLADAERREMNIGVIYPASITGTVYMDNDFSGTLNNKEIIYVPMEKLPVFGFRTPETEAKCEDFYVTCYVLNNLQPVGNPVLVVLWVMVFLMVIILAAAAIDIAVFLILKNLVRSVWKILTDTATGFFGRFAKVVAIAVAVFLVFVFVKSGVWERYYAELLSVLGW